MSNLSHLERWATPLLEKLEPAARKTLARTLATELRRNNRKRIADQQNPDGSAFTPRRSEAKAGRIKRQAMFQKLRLAKHLKTKYNANSASIGFFGDVARIARTHHYGLRDRTRRGGPEVQYDPRELVGFSASDIKMIESKLMEHLL